MQEWRWINKQLLLILHDESLALHGGTSGIRDEGLLDSELNRTINLAFYGSPDFSGLAAAYCVGLAKNHPFIDGNKRVAFLSIGLFLGLNGYKLTATQVDATLVIQAVASGEMLENELGIWIRKNSVEFPN